MLRHDVLVAKTNAVGDISPNTRSICLLWCPTASNILPHKYYWTWSCLRCPFLPVRHVNVGFVHSCGSDFSRRLSGKACVSASRILTVTVEIPFRTIVYLNIICIAGLVVLAVSAIFPVGAQYHPYAISLVWLTLLKIPRLLWIVFVGNWKWRAASVHFNFRGGSVQSKLR